MLKDLCLQKTEFEERAENLLSQVQGKPHIMVAVDIEHFRLFNKIYGREAGDYVLDHVADCIKNLVDTHGGMASYMGGDNFSIIMENDLKLVEELEKDILNGLEKYNTKVMFYPIFGVAPIKDTTESVVGLYDNATMALSQTRGRYANRIGYYNSEMEEDLVKELELLSDIQDALEKEEFTFFAQPQCDILTGKIVGAESLVRWIHPEKGMISPGVFIPVLEKNGLIYELDRYVWERVCRWLRSWINRGHHPIPLSINVSRMDILSMDVCGFLKELMEVYNLPKKYLKVEITEGAYAESNGEIDKVVKNLRDEGFIVMMDDFGSGYSSLNMLKNVSVDVIKLDMRFLDISEKEEENEKGIGILESVVNMTKTMGLPIIVEGVETKGQEKFLLSMGCRYIQGFYYYRPLPLEQFEELLADERKLDFGGVRCSQVEGIHVRELLDDNLFDDVILNNMLGATAFYEVYENNVEITRVNQQYFRMAGIAEVAGVGQDVTLWNHVRDDDYIKLLTLFEQAYDNPDSGAQGPIHFVRTDGNVLWVYIKLFFMEEREGRKLYFGSLVDMTDLRVKKSEPEKALGPVADWTEEQQSYVSKHFDELPVAFGVAKMFTDESGESVDYDMVYVNRELAQYYGGNSDRLKSRVTLLFEAEQSIVPKAFHIAYNGGVEEIYTYSSLSNRYLQLTLYQYDQGYVGCILRDVTHTRMNKDALDQIMQSYREVYFINLKDNYCRMIYPNGENMLERGNYEELVNRHYGNGRILTYDEKNVRKFLSLDNLKTKLRDKEQITYRYRRSTEEIPDEWCQTTIAVSERKNGEPKTAVVMVRSIDAILKEEENKRQQNMAKSLTNMAEGFFVYEADKEKKILYANPKVLQIFGCRTMEEFMELTGGTFCGMVHKEDFLRIESEIQEQIHRSDSHMDYIQYRIVRKDGEERWVDDWGHLEDNVEEGSEKLFYVFIKDSTDTINERDKDRLMNLNRYY